MTMICAREDKLREKDLQRSKKEKEKEKEELTCRSIWFSFCKVESLSSSSEFLFSNSLILTSSSIKYAFFLSLACCADTLFLNNLISINQPTNQPTTFNYHNCNPSRIQITWQNRVKYLFPVPFQTLAFLISWTPSSLPLMRSFCAGGRIPVSSGGGGATLFSADLWHSTDLLVALHS